MRISTKGRYALQMMLHLSINGNGDYIKIKEIAESLEVSDKYLEQIVTLLSRAGFVKSVRGASGGYKLAKEPHFYTVGMILRLTEGSLAPVACLDDETDSCSKIEECATIEVFKRLDEAIKSVIDTTTIADLVDIQLQKQGNSYVI
ncbi:MAG: Rrf2 family transcriptional regulator [Clostridiales bacterium]|nr:Rrf2 family transcriptional regulator [Clostridiales bacterium]